MLTLFCIVRLLTHTLLPSFVTLEPEYHWTVAALAAVLSVNVILGVFCVIAYQEEVRNWANKEKLDEVKRKDWDDKMAKRRAERAQIVENSEPKKEK